MDVVSAPIAEHRVFLGLGSNLGDRRRAIEIAVTLLERRQGLRFVARSDIRETEPEGKRDQPRFLNCVAEFRVSADPRGLLEAIRETESALGRVRRERWGPRTIDIDILCYGDRVVREEDLTVPHPLMHERRFVLEPFAEIAPEFVHPVLQESIERLLEKSRHDQSL